VLLPRRPPSGVRALTRRRHEREDISDYLDRDDEAPALATYSFLPIVRPSPRARACRSEKRDISLAGRIIANFPERLTEAQRIPDYLSQLGELTLKPEANIIKLPTSPPRSRNSRKPSRSCRRRATRSRTTGSAGKRGERAIQARYAKVLGAPSTRCFVRQLRTAARRSR